MLEEGGFDLRQWASSHPEVVAHLPSDARSSSTEQWLMQCREDLMEPTLGLRWNCAADSLGYHYQPIEHTASGKDPWKQWTTYTLTLLQLEQTTDSSGWRGTGPPTKPGFSQGFFLHSVTDGVFVPCRCCLWLA